MRMAAAPTRIATREVAADGCDAAQCTCAPSARSSRHCRVDVACGRLHQSDPDVGDVSRRAVHGDRRAHQRPFRAPARATPARTLTILGAGDELLHPPVWAQAQQDATAAGRSGLDFDPIFAGVKPEISGGQSRDLSPGDAARRAPRTVRGVSEIQRSAADRRHSARHRLRHVLDGVEPHARSGYGGHQAHARRARCRRRQAHRQLPDEGGLDRPGHRRGVADRRRRAGQGRSVVVHVRVQRTATPVGRGLGRERDGSDRDSRRRTAWRGRPAPRSSCSRSTGASSIRTHRMRPRKRWPSDCWHRPIST